MTSWYLRPERSEDILECLDFAETRGMSICPVGARNSFGDIFLLGDHVGVDMSAFGRVLDFDRESGLITVESGVRDVDLLSMVMLAGWQLPALSGSPTNTMAGNLSSNINGKDSWCVGTFGDQVVSFEIVLADGSTLAVDRRSDADLFAAVVGGLGLFGLVTKMTLQLRPIPSAMLDCRSRPVSGLAQLLHAFDDLHQSGAEFAYAWLDGFAPSRAFGRAVFETASFTRDPVEIAENELLEKLQPREQIVGVSPELFWGAVSRGWKLLHYFGVQGRAFQFMNLVKYRTAERRGEQHRRTLFPDYQYPMVKYFPRWNLKFAPEGFHEVHILVATSEFEATIREVVAACDKRNRTPEVMGARRHKADVYPLSFAGDGMSFTIPIALAGFQRAEIERFRNELVDIVVRHSGKIYLSKFPYMDREAFRSMYPGYGKFVQTKERVDPGRVFWSDAAARLL